jgi:hypothetical protein
MKASDLRRFFTHFKAFFADNSGVIAEKNGSSNFR